MSFKIERYNSLDEAIKEDFIWAINNSDENGTRPRGKLVISITGADNHAFTITLPPSWVPVNLLDSASADDLKRSTPLRQYVGRKLVILAKKSSVDQLVNLPAYPAEYERVKGMMKEISLADLATASIDISTADGPAHVEEIITAPNDRVVETLNKHRLQLTAEDLTTIANNSTVGGFLYEIALEWNSYAPHERPPVEQTEAHISAASSGKLNAPVFSL